MDDKEKKLHDEEIELSEVNEDLNDGSVSEPSFSSDNEEILEDIPDEDSSGISDDFETLDDVSSSEMPNDIESDDIFDSSNSGVESAAPTPVLGEDAKPKEESKIGKEDNKKDENLIPERKNPVKNNTPDNNKEEHGKSKPLNKLGLDKKNKDLEKKPIDKDKKDGLDKKDSLDKKNKLDEKPKELEKKKPTDLTDDKKGGLASKIPNKKSAAIRKGLDASSNAGNGFATVGKGALKLMDSLLGKENVDRMLDKAGNMAIKKATTMLALSIIHFFLPLMLFVLMVYMILAPVMDALMGVDQALRKFANTVEKIRNLYINDHYGDSKETFYAELERLRKVYGDDLDEPLLLSATFYPEMINGYTTHYEDLSEIIDDNVYGDGGDNFIGALLGTIKTEIESVIQEGDSTYDEGTGLLYTTGKVYRLRKLAENMFSSSFLGSSDQYIEEKQTLGEWLTDYGSYAFDIFTDFIKRLLKNIVLDGLAIAAGIGTFKIGLAASSIPVIGWLVGGALMIVGGLITIFGIFETARDIHATVPEFKILVNALYLGYMSIKSIEIDESKLSKNILQGDGAFEAFKEAVELYRYRYKYSEDNFKAYLRETYIPHTAEYRELLSYNEEGDPVPESVERVINDIYAYRDAFQEIFMEETIDHSENYVEQCVGAIDKRLAAQLDMPVDIDKSNCVDFSGNNGFGYTPNGSLHNGIELNEFSAGVREGYKAYAVMDGVVKSSSADGTMQCVGGCIEISYKYIAQDGTNNTFDFSIIYKGLSRSSVTLNSGDQVTRRQPVGTIGTADESENMGIPSMYLEFRNSSGIAIDPTNMIAKCNSTAVFNYEGGVKIDIPQSFKQTTFHTVTCYGGVGWYKSCSLSNPRVWGRGDGQLLLYGLWKLQGGRYNYGIAVIKVDGVDRFMVAVTKDIGRVGSLINAEFKDGTVVPMIVTDEKDSTDKNIKKVDGKAWGHITCDTDTCKSTDPVNIIEMEVDPNVYNSKGNVNSSWGINWDPKNPVVSVTNNGRLINDSNTGFNTQFDFSNINTSDGEESYISTNGVKLCHTTTNVSKVDRYINRAVEIANDDTVGYSITSRDLNPNVDSMSFIYYSLLQSGVINKMAFAFDNNSIRGILPTIGFEEFTYKETDLQRGDIMYDPNSGHAGIFMGAEKEVAAYKNMDNQDGDSSGKEVTVSAFSNSAYNYKYIYRLQKMKADDVDNHASYGVASGSVKAKYKGTDIITVKTTYMGGTERYASMLLENGIKQNTNKEKWSGCCYGFARAQACGLYRGEAITSKLSGDSLKSQQVSFKMGSTSIDSDDCNAMNVPCDFEPKCFATEAEMTTYAISKIQEGKPVIILVSLDKSNDHHETVDGKRVKKKLTKEEFAKETGVHRHFLTAVGFKEGSNGTDSRDLIYIDSANASYRFVGDTRYVIKTTQADYVGDFCATGDKNYVAIPIK